MNYNEIISAGFKTEAAYTASIIKKELKAKYPGVKFSVRSESYTGGDSLRVKYAVNETTPKVNEIKALCAKYEAGHFDGMTDMYNYTNRTSGPTVKYLFIDAEVTNEQRQSIKEEIKQTYGINENEWNDSNFMYKKFQDGSASNSLVWREIQSRFYKIAK